MKLLKTLQTLVDKTKELEETVATQTSTIERLTSQLYLANKDTGKTNIKHEYKEQRDKFVNNIYIGNTTTLIDKVTLPIKLEPATPFDTEDKLQASIVRRLKRLVTISDSMLDLEQAIIGNYNNKLIEY